MSEITNTQSNTFGLAYCSKHGSYTLDNNTLSGSICPGCSQLSQAGLGGLSEQLGAVKPPGVKYDQEKIDMALLSPIALTKIAQVMTFGKKKYSAHNWRGGFAWSRVLSAAMRHLFSFLGGEDKDPETGLSHLAHLGCCIFFLLEFEETHPELDDRYKEVKK